MQILESLLGSQVIVNIYIVLQYAHYKRNHLKSGYKVTWHPKYPSMWLKNVANAPNLLF